MRGLRFDDGHERIVLDQRRRRTIVFVVVLVVVFVVVIVLVVERRRCVVVSVERRLFELVERLVVGCWRRRRSGRRGFVERGGTGGAGGMIGASSSTGPATCTWSAIDPCGPGMYCDAPGCGDGTCVPKGAADGGARALVCGCDGHTYWNPTAAARHGMATSAMGICPGSKCGGIAGDSCPPSLFCDYVQASVMWCSISDVTGTCIVMPDVCSPLVTSAMLCNGNQCSDECAAAKSGITYYLDASCAP